MTKISIIGAGAMGTALAEVLGRSSGNEIRVSDEFGEEIGTVDLIVLAVPTEAVREVAGKMQEFWQGAVILTTEKGLSDDGKLAYEMVGEELLGSRVGHLAGAGFADGLKSGEVTLMTIAGAGDVRGMVKQAFLETEIELEETEDMIGAGYAGVLKNVYSIGAGYIEGKGKDASRYITIAGEEMLKFILAVGGKEETLGLSLGISDLILCATDAQSRNRQFGIDLAQGKSVDPIQTIEGRKAAKPMTEKAKELGLELPLMGKIARLVG